MQIRFEFSVSYQDLMAYNVQGDADIYGIEAYGNTPHGIEYMRETFNHCGDPTSFDRNILSRQGGAVVHSCTKSPSRWTPQLYAAFVDWVYTKYAASKLKWAETCKRHGSGDEELAQFDPCGRLQRPCIGARSLQGISPNRGGHRNRSPGVLSCACLSFI